MPASEYNRDACAAHVGLQLVALHSVRGAKNSHLPTGCSSYRLPSTSGTDTEITVIIPCAMDGVQCYVPGSTRLLLQCPLLEILGTLIAR